MKDNTVDEQQHLSNFDTTAYIALENTSYDLQKFPKTSTQTKDRYLINQFWENKSMEVPDCKKYTHADD